MRLPRVTFTVRRLVVAVALVGVGFAALSTVYDSYMERKKIRARIAARQRLLRAIGDGNSAVLGRSAERSYRIPTIKELKTELDIAEAELKESLDPSSPQPSR